MQQGIKENLIQGAGFGATLTYKSSDPRVLSQNLDGNYTTSAFEWGWHDILFKLGLFGFGAYILLLFNIIWGNFKKYFHNTLLVSLNLGLIIILFIHIFSPYLNHPLGIGYLLLIFFYKDAFLRDLPETKK